MKADNPFNQDGGNWDEILTGVGIVIGEILAIVSGGISGFTSGVAGIIGVILTIVGIVFGIGAV